MADTKAEGTNVRDFACSSDSNSHIGDYADTKTDATPGC